MRKYLPILSIALILTLGIASISEAACSGGRCGRKPVRHFIGRILGR